MGTDSIESLKQALRRSLWILILLPILGIVQMNVVRQSQGPLYQASAQVILSPTDIAASLTGTQQYVDPQRIEDTEVALAESPQLFVRAAEETNGEFGDASELRGATSVDFSDNTINFTAQADNEEDAVGIANAAASAYPAWRAEVSSAALDEAIEQVEEQIELSGRDPSLVEQLNRLNVMRTLTSGNVLLVEEAEGAAQVRPNPLRDSILGFLIGTFAALMAVGFREAIDTRVRSESEIEELLDVPVVGTVESLPRRGGLVALDRRRERYQDMYALLAATLAQNRADGKPLIIAVTSASAGEGKTTTAANLAAAFALRNGRVLAVDLDGRRPALAKIFGIPNSSTGLEQVLTEGAPLASAMWRIPLSGNPGPVQRSGEQKPAAAAGGQQNGSLLVLPLQQSLPEPATRHGAQIAKLLDEVGKRVDYIVVDTPPALATADMTELAKIVDIVLVVVRHGRISRRALGALGKLVRMWSTDRTSAVLVDTPRQESTTYYYGRA
jgi:Mrp family chromosome partitioning ATPase